jgi:hypothetical protein
VGGEPRLVVGAAPHPKRLPLQPAQRRPHRRLTRFDHGALHPGIIRDGIEHGRRLRCLERQIEARHPPPMRSGLFAVGRQATPARSQPGQDGAHIIRLYVAVKSEPPGTTTDPHAMGFAGAGVVVVQRLGDPRELVGLLTEAELGDRQHHHQTDGPYTQRVKICERNPPRCLGGRE